MVALIEANLELCKIPNEERQIVQAEAADFLRQAVRQASRGKSEPLDIVFFDPPYATDYLEVLNLFDINTPGPLTGSGLIIVEHYHKKELPDELDNLFRFRILKQGDSSLSFYEMKQTSK
jgi:16S rRNA G966 N2-methylase RsmD